MSDSLKKFFKVNSIEDINSTTAHAANKTYNKILPTPAQRAWIGRARCIAEAIELSTSFDKKYFDELIASLRHLLLKAEDVGKAVNILSDYGIRLIFLEKLKSSKIDGASFFVNKEPVIAMSLRFDRIDNFWFNLRHELEHVKNEDALSILSLGEEGILKQEELANAAYIEFIDPNSEIEAYAREKKFSSNEICKLAKKLHIHPGLVAGQIQHLTGNYSLFRALLVKIRSYIIELGKNVDGWGHIAPTS